MRKTALHYFKSLLYPEAYWSFEPLKSDRIKIYDQEPEYFPKYANLVLMELQQLALEQANQDARDFFLQMEHQDLLRLCDDCYLARISSPDEYPFEPIMLEALQSSLEWLLAAFRQLFPSHVDADTRASAFQVHELRYQQIELQHSLKRFYPVGGYDGELAVLIEQVIEDHFPEGEFIQMSLAEFYYWEYALAGFQRKLRDCRPNAGMPELLPLVIRYNFNSEEILCFLQNYLREYSNQFLLSEERDMALMQFLQRHAVHSKAISNALDPSRISLYEKASEWVERERQMVLQQLVTEPSESQTAPVKLKITAHQFALLFYSLHQLDLIDINNVQGMSRLITPIFRIGREEGISPITFAKKFYEHVDYVFEALEKHVSKIQAYLVNQDYRKKLK